MKLDKFTQTNAPFFP